MYGTFVWAHRALNDPKRRFPARADSGVVGCYPAQGQRCFNDGAPCGHQLIEDFEMWVRPARTDQTDTHNTCAKLRHPGAVADLNPGDVRPFYGSTFSRTVGRLYGVTKGLAMWY